MKSATATVLLAVCILAGCGVRQPEPQIVDGVAYGVTSVPFRGRWWHYYERGVSWANGGFHAAAEADFRRALALRLGDSRRARTYGMRFVQCFLHRELAASLIALGRADEARSHLQLSLAQAPSAKAIHLLDAVDGIAAPNDRPRSATAVVVTSSVAAAPGGQSVTGRWLAAAGERLWAVAADGARRVVDIAADGGFAARLAPGERLAVESHGALGRLLPVETPSMAEAVPRIEILDPLDGAVLHGNRVWLRYRAQAANLAVLTVESGGRTVASLPLEGIVQAGTWSLPLEPGQHRLRVIVDSSSGATASLELDLTLHPDAASRRSWRAPALLVPLQAPRDSLPLDQVDDSRYAAALVDDGRFRYIDQRADDILRQELALVDAGHLDRVTAARAGRRLEARYVLAGTLRRGSADAECFIRLVHSASGKVVATADAYAVGPQAQDPQAFFAAVAGRLRQVYPVLQARLVGSASGHAVIDLGAIDGVADRMLFHLVEREPDLLRADGSVLLPGEERIIRSGEVVEVGPRQSVLAVPVPAADVGVRAVSE